MQKGLATLEMIFAVGIVAILIAVIIPKTARVLDRAALDYEYKKLYSDLRFLQAISRSGTFDLTGTGNEGLLSNELPYMKIMPNRRSWQIFRVNNNGGEETAREEHVLGNNINFSKPTGLLKITFDTMGFSEIKDENNKKVTSFSIILTSSYGDPNKIVFDSVGRFRGGRGND